MVNWFIIIRVNVNYSGGNRVKENVELNIVLNYLKNRLVKEVKNFRELTDIDDEYIDRPDNKLPSADIAELCKAIELQERCINKLSDGLEVPEPPPVIDYIKGRSTTGYPLDLIKF